MEFMEYWNLIIKRKNIIFPTIISVVLLTLIYIFTATPIYEVQGKLLLTEDSGSSILGDLAMLDLMTQSLGKSDPINTQMEVIKTNPILERVIYINGLTDAKGFPIKSRIFKEQLKISSIRNTDIIAISYMNQDPELAVKVVNTLARVFVEQNQNMNKEELSSAKFFIESQLEEQKEKLSKAEQSILDFKKAEKTISLQQETTARVDSLARLETVALELDTQLKGAYAQKKELLSKTQRSGAITQPFYAYWMRTLQETEGIITNTLAQKKNINEQINTITSDLKKLPPQEVLLARLRRDQQIANEIYTNLLAKKEEVKINEAATIANIKIIEPAIIPDIPVYPKKKKLLVFGLIGGVGLSFGLALLLEYIDDSPDSVESIKKVLPYDVIGNLPMTKTPSTLFIKEKPNSAISEALRLVHTNLKFKGVSHKDPPALLITSSIPSEGKSTIASNLAIAMTTNNKKVVLVNLDLRRPTIAKIFNIKITKGLTDFLINEATYDDILIKNKETNITIIPAGTIPPNPTELINSSRLLLLINKLKTEFHYVIFDSPPATLVAETLDIAYHMDGIILVTDISNTPLHAIKNLHHNLEGKKLPVLGTIVNKIVIRSNYYNKYYS